MLRLCLFDRLRSFLAGRVASSRQASLGEAIIESSRDEIGMGVCERTVRVHVGRGELAHIVLGRGTVRRRRMIHPDDLRAFINLMRRGGGSVLPIKVVGRPVRQRRRPAVRD
jgi:hypothetical protein